MTSSTGLLATDHLRALVDAQGPFVSVYFDDSRDVPDARAQRGALRRDLRHQLEEAGAGEASIAAALDALKGGGPSVGRRGRVLIVAGSDVLVDARLSSPPHPPVVRVSEYPYILPLVSRGARRPAYVFAAVDHVGAEIILHSADETVLSQTIDGGGFRFTNRPAQG